MPFVGRKKRMEEILDKEIIVKNYKITPSSKRDNSRCLHLQFDMDNEIFVAFSGSAVLCDLCDKYQAEIPFKTKIIKIDRYLTFS